MGLIQSAHPARTLAAGNRSEELLPHRRVQGARAVVVGRTADGDAEPSGLVPLDEIAAQAGTEAALLARRHHWCRLLHRPIPWAVHVEVLDNDQPGAGPLSSLHDVRLKRGELLHPARVLRSRALVNDRRVRDRIDRLLRKHHVRNPLIDAGRHGRFPSTDAPHAVSAPHELLHDGSADGSRTADDGVQLLRSYSFAHPVDRRAASGRVRSSSARTSRFMPRGYRHTQLHCHETQRVFTGSRVPGAPRRAVPGGRDIGARLPRVRQGSNGHGRETHPSWSALGGFAPGERGRGLRRSAIRFGACPSRPPECPRWATLSQGTCRTRCTCSRTVGCSWLSRRSRAIIWRLALDEVGRCRNLG